MRQLEPTDPRIVGRRIAEARKSRGMTQEEAATFLGYSRPTYIAIEKGERPAKAEEIVRLAGHFGRAVHELVRASEPVAGFQPHLRVAVERMKTKNEKELLDAAETFERLAEDYRELERLMNAPLRTNYPPARELNSRIDPAEFAETVAAQERTRLGLGDQPVLHLRRALEWDAGIRVFYWPLPSAIAGMYASAADLGCCVLVNLNHPEERRRMTLLHEYGHVIIDRFKPGVDYLTPGGRKPANERFAEAFALNFLMPRAAVLRRFHEVIAATGDFQVSDLVRLGHHFYVSLEAMTLRLEELGLIPKGSLDGMKEESFAPRKALSLLALEPRAADHAQFPERYQMLAVQAHEEGKISEGQLARFLRCDVVTARGIAQECRTGSLVNEQGEERRFRLELHQSLLGTGS